MVLRSLPLAAPGCRRLPLAAGRPPQMEDEDYVVAAAAGAAGTRGARRLRRDAVRHRAWRAERIGASGHRVAVRASATESGAEEDEAGAAFKWKWNIDGGELFEECLRRAKLEGHLPDLMRGCPFSGQTALTRSMLRALTLPYVTRALNGDFPGSDLKAAEEAHIASLDAYCRKHWAPTGQVANGRWPGGAPLWWHTRASLDDGEWVPRVPAWQCAVCGEEAFPFEECGRCRPARTAPVQHGVPASTQGRV